MRWLCRMVGWILLILALLAGARDLLDSLNAGAPHILALGELWARLHQDSLLLAEPAIDRHVWPGLWQTVILPVLLWPAIAVFGVPAIVLLLLCRRRRRRLGLRR